MIGPGFETTEPRTGTRTVLVEGAEETGGRGWVLEVHCPEGAPPAIPAHLHEHWTETFEIPRTRWMVGRGRCARGPGRA